MKPVARIFCMLLFFTLSIQVQADDHKVIVSDFYSLYSPEASNGQLWMGGWMESPKAVPWPDKIYSSRLSGDGFWSFPKPISITSKGKMMQSGEISGYHINDPSIVMLDESKPNDLLMFYTAFPNDAIDASACNPAVNPVDCLDVKRHAMGVMKSRDAGNSWKDAGIILSHANGVWSASVIVLKNQLWVYYMDATMPLEASSLFLQRLDVSSFLPLAQRKKIEHPGNGIGNPDVHLLDGRFILLGNRAKASQVVRYESPDGHEFSQSQCWPQPLIEEAGVRLDGPDAYRSDDKSIMVFTGFNAAKGSTKIVSWQVFSNC